MCPVPSSGLAPGGQQRAFLKRAKNRRETGRPSPTRGHFVLRARGRPGPLERYLANSQGDETPPSLLQILSRFSHLGTSPNLAPVGPWPEQACLHPSMASVSPTQPPGEGALFILQRGEQLQARPAASEPWPSAHWGLQTSWEGQAGRRPGSGESRACQGPCSW